MAPFPVNFLKQQFQAWFVQQKTIVEETTDLVSLPDSLNRQLIQQVATLPSSSHYYEPIQEAIATTIATWQTNLEAPNSFVLLGNPVEPLPQILSASIPRPAFPDLDILTPLDAVTRASQPQHIKQQIQRGLEMYGTIQLDDGDHPVEDTAEALAERTTLVIIPCLEQCFLRCIGGWEGIEMLRDIVTQNRHCFWLMSCNHWAWDFLDFVGQISAYFSHVDTLPPLDGKMLQAWLDPVAQVVLPPTAADDPSAEDTNGDRQTSWHSLSDQAKGISQIAASLWLQSLRIEQEQCEQYPDLQFDFSQSPEDQPLTLQQIKPTLPMLPSLTSEDLYILHSVLIHSHISRDHLALSLGESRNRIQSRIQWLVQQGILQENQRTLSLQAAHYIRLKSELANNNFFVGED